MKIVQTRLLPNYVRTHRKKAGLSQRELGILVGYEGEGQISRHERFHSVPPFMIAVAYEVVFKRPIAEIFPGLRQTVESEVEQRLDELQAALGRKTGRGRYAATTARKLEWITEHHMLA